MSGKNPLLSFRKRFSLYQSLQEPLKTNIKESFMFEVFLDMLVTMCQQLSFLSTML